MKLSLIITTYNWKEALERSLISIFHQSLLPGEIIVADDGSHPETGEMVKKIAANAPIPVIHSWHKDKGFRAAMARNIALAKTSCEYIILIDQDMVLTQKFCEDHAAAARPGFFIQGSRVLLDEIQTSRILNKNEHLPGFFEAGIENRKNCIRAPFFSRLFSLQSKNLKGIRTCNFAFWKKNAIEVNGFNDNFIGWGREDSDFAARLLNSGVLRRNLRFSALAYHLYHPQIKKRDLTNNNSLLDFTVANKLKRCENGLDKYFNDIHP